MIMDAEIRVRLIKYLPISFGAHIQTSTASALQFLAVMNIFIPGLDGQLPPKSQNDSDSDSDTATPSVPTSRDVQSKFAILRTSANVLTGAKVPVKRYKRITRFLQCQCGVDHTTGRFAKKGSAATRQIPWPDVGCLVFIKIVSLHDLQRGMPVSLISRPQLTGIRWSANSDRSHLRCLGSLPCMRRHYRDESQPARRFASRITGICPLATPEKSPNQSYSF
jgi:hypothetical protein